MGSGTGPDEASARPNRSRVRGAIVRSGARTAPVRLLIRRAVPRPGGSGRDRPVVPPLLRSAAGYAWRLLVVAGAAYAGFLLVERLELIAIAVFVALVVTSVLRPVADRLAHAVPRKLAVLAVILGALLLVGGLLSLIGEAVAAQAPTLRGEFSSGLGRVERWLERPPFHVGPAALSGLQKSLGNYLSTHRATVVSTAVNGAGRVVEVATGGALALFCSVFFIHSGDRMWHWVAQQTPGGAPVRLERAAKAAWQAFAGYTRGIFIVAASNAVMVGVSLYLLRVPLALPLTLLEFFATFVPLVGSPVAMAVAAVVGLAARGPVTAAIVLVLIVVIGQVEGHVLQPLVMGWAVRLHPVVVALSVLAGGILAGIPGAVVAVPVVSVAWAVVRELRTAPPAERGAGR
ncbi:AI-2E family transporter [Streptacidiphilus albus]|uniref:AI-2E family transporter n=1 Tax=Streptacidiphilus albus TaxID=105425 RepID=UPI000A5FF5B0